MIAIERSDDGGKTWVDWDTTETVSEAVARVKSFCLMDKSAFRVIEVTFLGIETRFQWGPFPPISSLGEEP